METEIFKIGREVGAYRIVRVLGSGGMGVVYEVEHLRLKVRRALKVIAVGTENAALHRERFLAEGKVLSALDHPRVVRVHEFDLDEASGLPYFVMDLVLSSNGSPRTLEDERRAGITEERVKGVLNDLTEALGYVHSRGIVHLDVKLENILVSADGHVVLADFGISRIFDESLRKRLDIALTLPQESGILHNLGSAYYRAPELQTTEATKPSPASDLWALGIVLFRLLTGVWLEVENQEACLGLLEGYVYDWRSVVEALCARDPSSRHLVSEVCRAKTSEHVRTRRWLVGAAICLLGVVGVIVVMRVFRAPSPCLPSFRDEPARQESLQEEPAGDVSAPEDVIRISEERQAQVKAAEMRFFERELYEPVARALADEPETNRVAWSGVLQTSRDMLYHFYGSMKTYREFVGRGAQQAYDRGCRYPLPIAFTHASLLKRPEVRQECHRQLLKALETDTRWNPATLIGYYDFMSAKDSTPSEVTNADDLTKAALKRFFRETPPGPDEMGAAVRYIFGMCAFHLWPVVEEYEKEGGKLDPWLHLMFKGIGCHERAWSARGKGFAWEVPSGGNEIFDKEIDEALEIFEEAYRLRPDLPQSTSFALACTYGRPKMRELWERRARASRYANEYAIVPYLWGLRPRWCGSLTKMVAYCECRAKEKRFDTIVPAFVYEKVVNDVFLQEGGLRTHAGRAFRIHEYVKYREAIYRPYFEGYRNSPLMTNGTVIERSHICNALADLAWRLEDADELVYWTDELEKIGMPYWQLYFNDAGKQYHKYLPVIRRLEGERRREFVRGLHAYFLQEGTDAIARLAEIAAEEGLLELSVNVTLLIHGKADLRVLYKKNAWPCYFEQRLPQLKNDHLLLHVRLRAEKHKEASFQWSVDEFVTDIACPKVSVKVQHGAVAEGMPQWPMDEEVCEFTVEVDEKRVCVRQEGRLVFEKTLRVRPALAEVVTFRSEYSGAVELEQCEVSFVHFQ